MRGVRYWLLREAVRAGHNPPIRGPNQQATRLPQLQHNRSMRDDRLNKASPLRPCNVAGQNGSCVSQSTGKVWAMMGVSEYLRVRVIRAELPSFKVQSQPLRRLKRPSRR